MKAPISWIKDYTNIKSDLKQLMWKLTEIGLTCEFCEKVEGEDVLDIEVTPNRPDWLSIIGIAREISVIENSKIKLPEIPPIPKPTANLPIDVKVPQKLVLRYSGVTIQNVQVKPSPDWIVRRLKMVGLRPINNLVDITNYVMFEFGIPIHVFDYDKFVSKQLSIELSKGGETFTSVDGITYTLPENSLIIKDKDRVVDLCGIKGGENTGISQQTRNIFVHIPIYSPVVIRRTSQSLKLASQASYIYERGPDLGGTITSLKRTVDLILRLAGGETASEVIDIKKDDFSPKTISFSFDELLETLGIKISLEKVIEILSLLDLSPKSTGNRITIEAPTRRSDINIKEDVFEEVARIWGYNNFDKTLPSGSVSTNKIPYFYDRSFEMLLKNLLSHYGYIEINTLALTSEELIKKTRLNIEDNIKILNPVSKEYEYFRTSLVPNLISAIKLNSDYENLQLFEYNKTYVAPIDNPKEKYFLSGIEKGGDYRTIKGVVEYILNQLGIEDVKATQTSASGIWHPLKTAVLDKDGHKIGVIGEIHPEVVFNFDIKGSLFAFELDVEILKELKKERSFKEIPKYPPHIEDVSLSLPKNIGIGDVIQRIKSVSEYISDVHLKDKYQNKYTVRIQYLHPDKTLNDSEVGKIREKLFSILKNDFSITIENF
jgi:phenylalanyl-tRNA synthetase beta chain